MRFIYARGSAAAPVGLVDMYGRLPLCYATALSQACATGGGSPAARRLPL